MLKRFSEYFFWFFSHNLLLFSCRKLKKSYECECKNNDGAEEVTYSRTL